MNPRGNSLIIGIVIGALLALTLGVVYLKFQKRISTPPKISSNVTNSEVNNSLSNRVTSLSSTTTLNKVVFTKKGDIWSVNADGTDLKQLTNYGLNFNPQLSPLGDYVVYYSVDKNAKQSVLSQTISWDDTGVNIWSIKVDGTNPVKLTDSNPAAHRKYLTWNIVGNQVLYDEDGKIMIVNQDGSNKRTVIDLNTISDFAPTQVISAPDGYFAVTGLTKEEAAQPCGDGCPSFTQIVEFDGNGKIVGRYQNTIRLLRYWSPINNKLYFVDATNGIGGYGLESINVDGTNRTLVAGYSPQSNYSHANLPPSSVTDSAIYSSNGEIAVSKKGKTIATIRGGCIGVTKNNCTPITIWLMSIDGSNSRSITLPDSIVGMPEEVKWMSDSQHLIFRTQHVNPGTIQHPGTWEEGIYSIKSDGSDLKVLDTPHVADFPKAPYIINDDEFSTGVESLY